MKQSHHTRSKPSRLKKGNWTQKQKTIRGTKNQKSPSASYYYKVLGKPVGYKTSYRPQKNRKPVNYSLQLRKNGTAYWKSLSKKTSKVTKHRKKTKNRTRSGSSNTNRGGRTSFIKQTRYDTRPS